MLLGVVSWSSGNWRAGLHESHSTSPEYPTHPHVLIKNGLVEIQGEDKASSSFNYASPGRSENTRTYQGKPEIYDAVDCTFYEQQCKG